MLFSKKHLNISVKIITILLIVLSALKYRSYINPDSISEFVLKYDTIAPFIFILICAVKPLFFFLPVAGLTVIAGLLFGPVRGTIYVAIGGSFSTIVGFYFARWMGKGTIRKLYGSNRTLKKMDEWTDLYGKYAVLWMRIFNVPWDIVSYWAGCSNIRFKDFYLPSIIVLFPISFLYTYFGSKVLNPRSPGFIISLALIILFAMVPIIRNIWIKKFNGAGSNWKKMEE